MLGKAQAARGNFSFLTADRIAARVAERNKRIEAAYSTYHTTPSPHSTPVSLQPLELVAASDLLVTVARELGSEDIIDVNVIKKTDPMAINFMGYDRRHKCLAFKGEARLFDTFLDFASAAGNGVWVAGTFKSGNEIRVPPEIERGLSLDDFAGRVEILEYVMWMYGHLEDDENVEADLEQPISDSSPASRSCPPTPGVNYTLSDLLGYDLSLPSEESLSTVPRSTGYETSSRASSSSLSPPPETIITPPSMKGLSGERDAMDVDESEVTKRLSTLRVRAKKVEGMYAV